MSLLLDAAMGTHGMDSTGTMVEKIIMCNVETPPASKLNVVERVSRLTLKTHKHQNHVLLRQCCDVPSMHPWILLQQWNEGEVIHNRDVKDCCVQNRGVMQWPISMLGWRRDASLLLLKCVLVAALQVV